MTTLQAFLESTHQHWYCLWFNALNQHIDIHVRRESDGTFHVQRQFSRSTSADAHHLSVDQVIANLAQSGISSDDEEGEILDD